MQLWQEQDWLGRSGKHGEGIFWRAVEAQHVVATMRLVDTLDEQALLEHILEGSKPPLPKGIDKGHYLVTTPFRYTAPVGSRFRRADTPGVWYGGSNSETACAEVGYWRWRFLMAAEKLRDGELIIEHTLFQAKVSGPFINLTESPWSAFSQLWQHISDYSSCQELADQARANAIEWIGYQSVRSAGGFCAAVFDANALTLHEPTRQETWVCKVKRDSVIFSHAGNGHTFNAVDWK